MNTLRLSIIALLLAASSFPITPKKFDGGGGGGTPCPPGVNCSVLQ